MLRETVRAAGPLFLTIARAISRAARAVLQRARSRIASDAGILIDLRVQMGLPPEGRLQDIRRRYQDESGPKT